MKIVLGLFLVAVCLYKDIFSLQLIPYPYKLASKPVSTYYF